MILTELMPLGGERFLAKLSDGTELRLSSTLVADLSLYRGMKLSEEDAEELILSARLFSCKERALKYIGARPMSKKELYDKLTEKGETPEDARECVRWLADRRYLDDGQYASMLVRHFSAKGYGVHRVKNELYRRGVPKELWEEALEDMPDMDEKVYRLLCVKLKSEAPDRAEMKKATDSLYRRGFSWDEIKAAANRYREENGGEDYGF